MVASLHAGLTRILDEGLDAVWAPHQSAGDELQVGLEDMGLELLERYDIEIGDGAGPSAASVWRIGLMGHNARPDVVLLVLAALLDVLGRA